MLLSSAATALKEDFARPPLDKASLECVKQNMSTCAGRAYGYFGGNRLDSVFQPIYSLSHRRIVGHEGLLRATNLSGKDISPMQVFRGEAGHISDSQAVFLDRLCRTVHLHNYRQEQSNQLWLFLNVSSQIINRRHYHSPFFVELMASYGVSPKQIVIEIVEGVIPDARLLDEVIKFYRDAGCLIAIDDFGAEASDIERIWRVSPDIVKLDRKLIASAESNDKARRILRATVALIHECGSLALIEGVENREQAIIALDCNADLVQGFYYARPASEPLFEGDGGIGELADQKPVAITDKLDMLLPYMTEFKMALKRLEQNQPIDMACDALLSMEKIDRCYVLNQNGQQMGETVLGKRLPKLTPFLPLESAAGADWSRKPYFYRAIFQPGELQVSRPYLSIASSRLCVTLSATYQVEGQTRVLCCDVEWYTTDNRHISAE